MRRNSRAGGAHSPPSASPTVLWSDRLKWRISSTSSPKSSRRSGWGLVGTNTSTMEPRTATCPRFSTISTASYPSATSCSWSKPGSIQSPTCAVTGVISPIPAMRGCIRVRTGSTRTEMGPAPGTSSCGWVRRRRIVARRAIVSTWGESRSCGRVSQEGIMATPVVQADAAWANFAPWRPEDVTTTTGDFTPRETLS